MGVLRSSPETGHEKQSAVRWWRFVLVLLIIIGAAIARSAVATRLDSFTIDEAYHIAAGVSYVKMRDFRVNPEHPPLVKLWVGSLLSMTGFRLAPLRLFHDKPDERTFTADAVFRQNDPDAVQRRSRIAMWALNGLLLMALALSLRRCFGESVALGTIVFLAIDPTVAAHLPVVMTDLPVALLSATTVVLATRAFQTWVWSDLIWCSFALGLALAAKHSAPVFYIFVGILGAILIFVVPTSVSLDSRARRLAKLCGVLVGAWVILWVFYSFRFRESSSVEEVFNRPLAQKIDDVRSPAYHLVLSELTATHILPRAYIWGFADTVHAGLEGRAFQQLAFGRPYYNKAPWYFFPGVIAAKLPIGLGLIVLLGFFLLAQRRYPHAWNLPATILVAASFCFLLVLGSGSTYAGVRHALPVVALLAILGGMAIATAFRSKGKTLRVFVVLTLLAAMASALPVLRPWEYFNEIAGGANKGYLYFDDDGVDLGQRAKELARYYQQVIQPTGEVPFISYGVASAEKRARRVDWLGADLNRDESRMNERAFSGTVLINARSLSRRLWWDMATLRAATPVARFGNLLVFQGTFDMRGRVARELYRSGVSRLFASKPDLDTAERMLKESVAADQTAFFVYIELGNVYLQRGSRSEAEQAYTSALEHAPPEPSLRHSIQSQIGLLRAQPLQQIAPLRDPGLE